MSNPPPGWLMHQVQGQSVVNTRGLSTAPAELWLVFYDRDTGRPAQSFGPEGWCKGAVTQNTGEMCGGCDACLIAQAVHAKMPHTKHATKQQAEAVFAIDALLHVKDEE